MKIRKISKTSKLRIIVVKERAKTDIKNLKKEPMIVNLWHKKPYKSRHTNTPKTNQKKQQYAQTKRQSKIKDTQNGSSKGKRSKDYPIFPHLP